MSVVYVLSKDGKPLMPTTRCGHIRILLKTKKARVVQTVPFVIRLNYETEDIVQSLVIGVDPGRTNIGMAVVREDGECVFSAQVHTRNKQIPKLMKARKQYRQAHRRLKRRCKRQRRAKRCGTGVKYHRAYSSGLQRAYSLQRYPQQGSAIQQSQASGRLVNAYSKPAFADALSCSAKGYGLPADCRNRA